MTKIEAIADFRMNFPLTLSSKDSAAIRMNWNDYVDFLQKSNMITSKQANTWVNPFLPKNKR